MTLSFTEMKFDDLGRVVLSENDLSEIDSLGLVSSGGNDGQTNSGVCTNTARCADTTNGQCTNTQNACEGAKNGSKCIQPKEIELEP